MSGPEMENPQIRELLAAVECLRVENQELQSRNQTLQNALADKAPCIPLDLLQSAELAVPRPIAADVIPVHAEEAGSGPLVVTLPALADACASHDMACYLYKFTQLAPGETIQEHLAQLESAIVPSGPFIKESMIWASPQMLARLKRKDLQVAQEMSYRHWVTNIHFKSEWQAFQKNCRAGRYHGTCTRGVIYPNEPGPLANPMYMIIFPVIYIDEEGRRWWGMLRQVDLAKPGDIRLRAWALRDQLSIKYVPSMVSIVDIEGGIMRWQNSASMAALGCHGTSMAIPSCVATRPGGSAEFKEGASASAPTPLNYLELLFHSYADELVEMRAAVERGEAYRVRMEITSPVLRRLLEVGPDMEAWHEVQITRMVDPVTLSPLLAVSQMDVTDAVLSQRRVEQLQEETQALLQQILPQQVIDVLLNKESMHGAAEADGDEGRGDEDGAGPSSSGAAAAAPAAAAGTLASINGSIEQQQQQDGQRVLRPSSTMGSFHGRPDLLAMLTSASTSTTSTAVTANRLSVSGSFTGALLSMSCSQLQIGEALPPTVEGGSGASSCGGSAAAAAQQQEQEQQCPQWYHAKECNGLGAWEKCPWGGAPVALMPHGGNCRGYLMDDDLPDCPGTGSTDLESDDLPKLSRSDVMRLATWHEEVSILFSDIKGFTNMSQQLHPAQVMLFLNHLYSVFDDLLQEHDVYKVETIGDSYMVAAGLFDRSSSPTKRQASAAVTAHAADNVMSATPADDDAAGSSAAAAGAAKEGAEDGAGVVVPPKAKLIQPRDGRKKRRSSGRRDPTNGGMLGGRDPEHATKLLRFAKALVSAAAQVRTPLGEPVQLRVGLHTGPVMSGVVGRRMPRFCLFGDTVNTASRMETTGEPGRIHASQDFYTLTADESGWEPQRVYAKGKGEMQTYFLDC